MDTSRFFKTAAIAGLATMTLASCASSGKAQKDDSNMNMTKDENMEPLDNSYLILSDSQRSAINSTNTFAINLFRTQIGMDSKVLSPLSVAYLMGMLANGANGNTQEELMNALGMKDKSLNDINEAYKAVINMASRLDRQTTINIANCIAVNKQVKLKDNYAKSMNDMYDADVENISFASPKALEQINGWCSKQTDGMIPKIIDQLDANATAVLMNAIYFKGTWADKFDKKATQTENFRGYTRDIKRVQMMHQSHKFYYYSNNDLAAVRLPYGNGTYTMTVILPNEGTSTTEIINSLDIKKIEKIGNNMEECIVDLKLPRFTTTTKTELNKPISQLGVASIFQPDKADFGNMSNSPMFLSSMFQKAKIEVSEEGTKAAAVTAGIMMMSALPDKAPRRVSFHANRPFVYMITERNTGAIFFIGQYTGAEE